MKTNTSQINWSKKNRSDDESCDQDYEQDYEQYEDYEPEEDYEQVDIRQMTSRPQMMRPTIASRPQIRQTRGEDIDYVYLNEIEMEKRINRLQEPSKMTYVREPRLLPPDDVMWDEFLVVLEADYNKKQKEIDEENERKRNMSLLKFKEQSEVYYWLKVTSPISVKGIKQLKLPTSEEKRIMNTILSISSAIKKYFKPIQEAREREEKNKAYLVLVEEQRKRDEERERLSEAKRIATQKRIQENRYKQAPARRKKPEVVVTDKGLTEEERTKRNAEKRKKATERKEKELEEARKTIVQARPANLTVVVFDVDEEETETEPTTEQTPQQEEKTQEIEYIKTFASIVKSKIETDDKIYQQLKMKKELKEEEDSDMEEYIRGLMAVGSIKQVVKSTRTYSSLVVKTQSNDKKPKKLSLEEFNKQNAPKHFSNTYSHAYTNSYIPQQRIEYQKVCNSISVGVKCRFGTNCKFVHTFEDLKKVECRHKDGCNFVKFANGEYVNSSSSGTKCCHIHPAESVSNICKRLGITQPQQPKPQPIVSATPSPIAPSPIAQKIALATMAASAITTRIANPVVSPVVVSPVVSQPVVSTPHIHTHSNPQEYIQYQQVCMSVETGTACKYGSRCKFVHTSKDLKIVQCKHNEACKFVQKVNGGEYINTSFGKNGRKCCHIHPEESVDNICKRLRIKK